MKSLQHKNVIEFSAQMKDLLIIIVLFVIAHGLMLLNGGVYWDDWVLFHVDNQEIMNQFCQMGIPQLGWIHILLHNHPFFYRGLTFVSLLLASVCVYRILLVIKEIKRDERFFLTLCFFLFPVNFAKIAAANCLYIFFLFLFMLATYFLSKYLFSDNKVYYVLALMTYFFSFTTSSLLVFYAVPLMLIAYHEKILHNWPHSITKFKQYIPFIILPGIFWLVKMIRPRPYGLYVGYNEITLRNIISAPLHASLSVYDNLVRPLLLPWNPPQSLFFIPLGFIIAVFLYIYFKKNQAEGVFDSRFLYLGLLFYFLAVFPYLAVGRPGVGYGYDWNSRDQLLVPFGAAFIFLFGTGALIKEFRLHPNIRALFLAVILASFATTQICYNLMFQRAWFKKLALIEAFKESPVIRDNTTFLVDDQTAGTSVYTSRFYEYNGMMKYAFGDEKRFAIDRDQLGSELPASVIDKTYKIYCSYPQYNMSQYVFKEPIYLITIHPGPAPLGLRGILKRTLMQWVKRENFLELTKKMVVVECSPLSK